MAGARPRRRHASFAAQLGLDRARILSSGAAPVHPDLLRWFLGIGLPIAEGYGQTEVSLATSFNPPERIRIGTVGPPFPDVAVRIADDGEILVGARTCAPGIGATDPRRTSSSTATVGCTPETSGASTPTAICASPIGRRT